MVSAMTSEAATTNVVDKSTNSRNVSNGASHGGLHVIIAGGGIGGLTAAIALRQRGHHVHVYEQSRFANEIGAAIHMTPNAMGVLKHIGIDPRDSGAVPLVQVRNNFKPVPTDKLIYDSQDIIRPIMIS
jgi:ribulose 1,5-bisphosphate synthetase/thiazole synthase